MTIETLVAPNPGPFTLDGTRSYIVEAEIVIDPGPDIGSHLDAILAAAPRLQAILVTHGHADHWPAAASLKAKTGAVVSAPPGVLDGVADEVLKDGAIRQIGSTRLESISTPGHTPEHFCFLTASGDLFSGDTILGEGTTIVEGNMRAYMDSLRKLRARAPGRIYPGHGGIRDDAVEWIDHTIAHRLEREEQILAAFRDGSIALDQLRTVVYGNLDSRLHAAAERQIAAHLEHLAEQGRIPRS